MSKIIIPLLLLIIAPSVFSWTLTKPALAPKVSGHGCCNIGEKLLLFGGLKEDRTATNELWIYQAGKWRLKKASNAGPGPRMYVGVEKLGDKVFVVGGWDPEAKGSGGTFKDEVWSLDPDKLTWAPCNKLPCGPISRHTTVTVGDSIIVHTFKPDEEGLVILKSDGTSHVQATTGDAPVGLSMCSAAALNDHQMLLFGGSTKTQQMSNDVFLLDTKSWKWTKLQSEGDIPPPRASSSMARVNDSSVVVFGGAGLKPAGYEGGAGLMGSNETYMVSVKGDVAEWKLVDHESLPGGRVAGTLNLLPNNHFLLTGGWDPATAETFDDGCTFEL
jgi:hypothetical protein